MDLTRKISLLIQSLFYLLAGINHYINPDFFLALIPTYIPLHADVNMLAGFFEILFGVGLLLPKFSKMAALGIITMLVVYSITYIYYPDRLMYR